MEGDNFLVHLEVVRDEPRSDCLECNQTRIGELFLKCIENEFFILCFPKKDLEELVSLYCKKPARSICNKSVIRPGVMQNILVPHYLLLFNGRIEL